MWSRQVYTPCILHWQVDALARWVWVHWHGWIRSQPYLQTTNQLLWATQTTSLLLLDHSTQDHRMHLRGGFPELLQQLWFGQPFWFQGSDPHVHKEFRHQPQQPELRSRRPGNMTSILMHSHTFADTLRKSRRLVWSDVIRGYLVQVWCDQDI